MWIRFKPVRVGIAISADRISVCVLGNTTTQTARAIELCGPQESRRAEIRQVLEAVASEQHNPCLDLFVAVMPDNGQCKFVQLPALSASELRSLVTGSPDRFFLLGDSDVSIGTVQSRQGERTLIAAASNDALDLLRQACDANWKIRAIVPAEVAFAAASVAANPNVSHVAAIRTRTACHVLRIENRVLTAVRRIPDCTDLAVIAEIAGAPVESVSLLNGVPEEIAARHAASSRGPFIRNNAEDRNARIDTFRSAALGTLATLILGLAAATVETRNQRSNAAAIESHRARVEANVLAGRKQIAEAKTVEEQIRAIDRLSQQSVHPADLLVQLGDFLPDNAYVTQLTVTADSATAEIAGPDAAAALGSLRRSRTFARAQVSGSIRLLNGTADSTVLETIRVHLGYATKRGSRR